MSLNPQPVGNSQEQYEFFEVEDLAPVSYTHLDVYKRQAVGRPINLSILPV